MTPADELTALAGKAPPGEWEAGGDSDPTAILAREGWAQVAMTNDALPEAGDNAAFIAAACNFVRSDAFRAMARDAAIGRAYSRWYGAAQGYTDVIADSAHAAIVRDAAASGAGEE